MFKGLHLETTIVEGHVQVEELIVPATPIFLVSLKVYLRNLVFLSPFFGLDRWQPLW